MVIIKIITISITANFKTCSSGWEIESLHFLTKRWNVRKVVHAHCCPTFVVTILKIFIFETRIFTLVATWSLDISTWNMTILWFQHTQNFGGDLGI